MKQRGYFNMDMTGFFIACLIVGITVGIARSISAAIDAAKGEPS